MLKKSLIINALAFLNIATASESYMESHSSCDDRPHLGCGQVQTLVVDGMVTDGWGNTWRRVYTPEVFNKDGRFIAVYPSEMLSGIILAGGGFGKPDTKRCWFFEADITKSGDMQDPIHFGKVIRVKAYLEDNWGD